MTLKMLRRFGTTGKFGTHMLKQSGDTDCGKTLHYLAPYGHSALHRTPVELPPDRYEYFIRSKFF